MLTPRTQKNQKKQKIISYLLTALTHKTTISKLLDKNQLYVNLSEIEDADFGVSAEDKALNKAFYGDS